MMVPRGKATERQAFEAAAVGCKRGFEHQMTEGQLAKLVENLEARVCEIGQGLQACQGAPNRMARHALERRLMELSDAYAQIFSLFARQIAGVTKTAREIVADVDREVEIAAMALEDSDNPETAATDLPVASDLPARSAAVPSLRVA